MTILDEIVETVRHRVREKKADEPIEEMKIERQNGRSLIRKIETNSNPSLIGELKRASPSSGLIRPDFQPSALAKSIVEGGAIGISVLTDPDYFEGSTEYFQRVSESVEVPVLRKDFIVDEYQLYESAAMNAHVVLLIAEVLGGELPDFVELTRELEMEPLVEIRNQEQAELAEEAQAKLIGVNNRDLRSMEIDLSRTERMLDYVPDGAILISESGIREKQDVKRVMKAGADAVLVGTALMESENVEGKVRSLVGANDG